MSASSDYEAALEMERLYEPDRDLTGPTYDREVTAESHTYEEWRQVWIERGLCPIDKTTVDEGSCPCCGWTLAAERVRPASVEDKPDYLPSIPGALTLDEYSPAQIDEAA